MLCKERLFINLAQRSLSGALKPLLPHRPLRANAITDSIRRLPISGNCISEDVSCFNVGHVRW
jgi:hypothetical protein